MKRKQKLIIPAIACCLSSCVSLDANKTTSLLDENFDNNYAIVTTRYIEKSTETIDTKELIDDSLEKEGYEGGSEILCCKVVGELAYYAVLVNESPKIDVCFLSVDPFAKEVRIEGDVTDDLIVELGIAPEWIVSSSKSVFVDVADGFDQETSFLLTLRGPQFSLRETYCVSLTDESLSVSLSDYSDTKTYDELILKNGMKIKHPRSISQTTDWLGVIEIDGTETSIKTLVMENKIAKEISKSCQSMRFVGAAEFIDKDENVFIWVQLNNYSRWWFTKSCVMAFKLDIDTMGLSYIGHGYEGYLELSGIIRI